MDDMHARTAILLGEEGISALQESAVMVFGLGGVGSYTVEALARAGVGTFYLIDHDRVATSNLNRQLHATRATLGKQKAELMAERVFAINPSANVYIAPWFAAPKDLPALLRLAPDYVVDAIDSVPTKLALAEACHARRLPFIASMGMASRLYPERLRLGNIYETAGCPLARTMRGALRKRNVPAFTVCYSTEAPRDSLYTPPANDTRDVRRPLGSVSFVPAAAGLMIAGFVVRQLAGAAHPSI